MSLDIHQFEAREDNYGVLVHDGASGQTASIDAPDAAAVEAALERTGWRLTHILVTHHHGDHIAGIAALKQRHGCTVIGPANPAIAGLDRTVADGEAFSVCGEEVRVIATPGHTLDMLNFHFPESGLLFAGDTLFAMGCGRVFEGDMAMMWASLEKLRALPDATAVYCGHEYTLANGRFALSVDGGNEALKARMESVRAKRNRSQPTLPTTIGEEKATNPFLRAADPAIRAGLGLERASDAEVFGALRRAKDGFRG